LISLDLLRKQSLAGLFVSSGVSSGKTFGYELCLVLTGPRLTSTLVYMHLGCAVTKLDLHAIEIYLVKDYFEDF
jgi:hypothetical protein